MNLLNPVGLLALLAIPPVVLLYFLKLKRLELRVPSVLLWRRYVQDMQASHPFQRLRFSLLLLLQIVILTLAALALARPYVQSRTPEGRSVAVILDGSLSMQATDVAPSRFDAARAQAIEVARALGSDDEMMAVLAGAQTAVLTPFTRDVPALERALSAAEASDCRGNLREAFALTMSLARGKQHTEVWILSDGAPKPEFDSTVPPGVEVHYAPVGERCRNVAITSLNARETYSGGATCQLLVGVRNYGELEVDCQVEISHNGELANVETLHIPPGQQASHLLEAEGLASGLIEARIDSEDDLPADNVARIVFRERQKSRVLLVTAGNQWLERVLSVDPRVEARVLAPGDWKADSDASGVDLAIFDNWAPSPLPRCNSLIFRATPEGGPVRSLETDLEGPTVLDWERAHPIFEYVDLASVSAGSMASAEPLPWARTIADATGGPLMVAGETEDTRCLWVAFDLASSSFPVRIGFPIFMRNAIQWLTADPSGANAQSYSTGSPVRVRLPEGASTVTVTSPDGATHEYPIRSEDREGNGTGFESFTFDQASEAGVYTFAVDGEVTDELAFNACDPEESNLAPSPDLALASGEAVAASSYVRTTRELWRWLVAAGLALLSLEWLVFHRRIG